MGFRDLKARTKSFAHGALDLCDSLPMNQSGRIIANQLGRSGTSVGANCRAACKARSQAEFIAKIGIVEEEVDESGYWIELAIERKLVKGEAASGLLRESKELTAIMAASRITATSNLSRTKRSKGQTKE